MAISRRLDDTFKVTVVLKGVDGALEVAGAAILMFVQPSTINAFVHWLTQHELAQDPHDFIATHLVNSAGDLTHGGTAFAAAYLLIHGIAKIVLVVALLRRKLWAYPAMMVLLGAFVTYQLYRLSYSFSIGLTLLTVFDALVVWLTWREYSTLRKRVRERRLSP